MKALFHLTRIRLTEQPAKLLYLAITLAAVILAWIVLSAFASPSLLSGSKVIKSEIVIGNARAQNTPFPVRDIPRIQKIPGVGDMRWSSAAAFFCADGSETTVTVTGWDGVIDDELRKEGASETDLATWHATENGVLVGSKISSQCGLNQGITITPENIFGRGELPLYVVAVLPEQENSRNHRVHAHYSYINRFMEGNLGSRERDMVMRAIVTVTDPAQLEKVARAIEQEFQSSDPPLEAMVLGNVNSLLGRFGQVQALLLLIMGALVLCVLLAFIAITAHLIAQRRANMAVLQTLGFSRRIQFFGLMLEITCVLIVGTLIGIAAGHGTLALLTPWATNTMHIGLPRPIDGAILILLPALLLLLIFTLTWPALQIAKLKPIDYLRL